VAAVDSFVPLGPAANHVLVSEEQIVQGARSLLAR
jgi:2-oxoisovalerate dehydrogenase E1 component